MIDKNYDEFIMQQLTLARNEYNRANKEYWLNILLFVGKVTFIQIIVLVLIYAMVINSSLK